MRSWSARVWLFEFSHKRNLTSSPLTTSPALLITLTTGAPASPRYLGPMVSETVELRGHIIDSLILPKVLDEILAHRGNFKIEEIQDRPEPRRSKFCAHRSLN